MLLCCYFLLLYLQIILATAILILTLTTNHSVNSIIRPHGMWVVSIITCLPVHKNDRNYAYKNRGDKFAFISLNIYCTNTACSKFRWKIGAVFYWHNNWDSSQKVFTSLTEGHKAVAAELLLHLIVYEYSTQQVDVHRYKNCIIFYAK